MGWNIFFYAVGCVVGALITWYVTNPKKVIDETYKRLLRILAIMRNGSQEDGMLRLQLPST